MGYKRIEEPDIDDEPVTLEEVKEHLNYTASDKDLLIASYIAAARSHIENVDHIVLARATYQLTLAAFPDGSIDLPNLPVIEVTEIAYDDGEGEEQTLDADNYLVDLSGFFASVEPVDAWPASNGKTNSVRVTFSAGFPVESGGVATAPAALRHAIFMLVAHYFSEREGAEIPPAVEALIAPYRVPVIA